MKKILLSSLLLFSMLISASAQSPVKVACVGNSITQGPGRDHPDSWPLLMQNVLGDEYLVKNFGVSGRTLLKNGDHPYWDEPQFQEVLDFGADILVIKLGTNDSKPQNWKHKEEFVQDYIDMITIFRETMPDDGEVYVCIPVPVFKDNFGITESVMVDEMRPMLKEIAKATNSKMINLYKPLKKHGDLFADGVHPNKEGNQLMAEAVAKKIK
ncbi:sialate O-acetylesterase [Echinicola strongylocentroti]|uniref:Sialate O-acetylesterase n=1 Tax=Echinicola strongylocentroti TaxID=1795355 RepID=A0A2Z4IHM3_9BACT|nr:GDSL-type esterase/lipase family protein [Echinicola strongylocentroti]AWW30435.1 sialate O-acetylesterase [Echinicola strongylocentroti]